MRALPLPAYLALNNPKGSQELIVKYNIRPAKSPKDMIRKLQFILKNRKEQALEQFAFIHPDKDLILAYADAKAEEANSNACGCSHSGVDGEGESGRTTEKKTTPASTWETLKPHLPILVGGTILLVGLVVIIRNA